MLKYALVFFFPEAAAKVVFISSAFALSMFTLQDAEHRVEVLVDKSAEPEKVVGPYIYHNAYHVSGTFSKYVTYVISLNHKHHEGRLLLSSMIDVAAGA